MPIPTFTSPLASARQVLLVVAPDWSSTTARLQRYARTGPGIGWQAVGGPVPVSLGRAGLAWGIGRHGAAPPPGPADPAPVKREGDGCAPAGVFAITALFGYEEQDGPFARAARLPYRVATRDLKCIDDPASRHYNRLVAGPAPIDWQSHEDMRRQDDRYRVGACVAHNTDPPLPGAGSCIFLHVWQAPGVPTAGCTAADLAAMTDICLWLDGAAEPLLVQLPAAEYRRWQAAWSLPAWPHD